MSAEKIFLFNNGSWDIILDQNGQVSVSQIDGDEIGFSGMFNLTPDENSKLWGHIDAINLSDLAEGNDSTEIFTFNLKIADTEVNRVIPTNIAKQNPKISELLEYLREIIQKYSDQNLAL